MLELPLSLEFQQLGVGNAVRYYWESLGPGFELLRSQGFRLFRLRFLGRALLYGGESGLGERGGDDREGCGEVEEIELGLLLGFVVIIIVVRGWSVNLGGN